MTPHMSAYIGSLQEDVLLPGKRVKVDTDPIALATDPRQLAALRTALAPLPPPTELLAEPLWRSQDPGDKRVTVAQGALLCQARAPLTLLSSGTDFGTSFC